ncbi:MAG: AI-2E family transporter [Desulfovibrionaceae bacterium]
MEQQPSPRGPFSKGIYSYFLLGLLVFALYLGFYLVAPFIHTFIIGAVLSIMAAPVFKRLLVVFGGRRNLSAAVTAVAVVFVIVLPTFFFVVGMVEQGVKSLRQLQLWALRQDFSHMSVWFDPYLGWFRDNLPFLKIHEMDIQAKVLEYSSTFAQSMFEFGKHILQNAAMLVVKFVLMSMMLFFFLRDGDKIIQQIKYLMPLKPHQEDVILDSLQRVSRSVLLGSLLIAALQGFTAGVGFAIAGIPGFFWGAMMAFAALIPVVGSSIIWLPTVAFLALSGEWQWAVFLFIWCFGLVVNIDTVLRPILLRGASKVSPFYIFVSILGGIGAFGVKGILYGPLILAFAMVMLGIYSEEFGEELSNGKCG